MDPYSILLPQSKTAMDAISIIDKSEAKIALVKDNNESIIGTITDGDIRRALLCGEGLDCPVIKIMNKNFKFIYIDEYKENTISLLKLIKEKELIAIPILDRQKKLVKVLFSTDLLENKIIENPVLIMAGGKGKRLYPQTENCPKPMLKVGNKPMLEIILENYILYGFKKFFISVHYKKEKIIDYFGDGEKWNVEIKYLVEEKPLGTAGCLSLLPKNINKSLIVINGDVITRLNPKKLLNFHNENKADGTICVTETEFNLPYGVVETEGIKLNGFQEKPSYRKLINAGIYVLNPNLISLIKSEEYLDMPNLFEEANLNDKLIIVYPLHEYWIDVGLPEKLKEAQLDFDM